MIAQFMAATVRREGGFMLATVLVFLVVLSLTVFFSAGMTRTSIQVVNNEQNQKEAFAAAEAGIDEALYRLSLVGGDTAAITGVNGGTAFDASLAPRAPGRSLTTGASDYGLNDTDTASTSQILFVTTAPASGQNNRVPTLQPPATNRSLYSTAFADSAPVDTSPTSTITNLTIGWDLCTQPQVDAGAPGCAGGAGTIRRLPTTNPRPVVKIVSTGQSGSARQRVTVRAVDCVPSNVGGPGGIVTLGTDCAQGLSLNGSNSITAAGAVQINAGADRTDPSSCTSAAALGGNSSFITAADINIVGGTSGNGTFTPTAETGVLPTSDPFSNLSPPCYPPASCSPIPTTQNGSAATPQKLIVNSAATLNPGIYFGGIDIRSAGVTMNSGIYIMEGGGFSVGNSGVVTSGPGGVMIYNTRVPGATTGAGAAASLSLQNGNTSPSLAALTSGPFTGFVFFQDRNLPSPQPDLFIQGGSNSGRVLDGIVYAPGAGVNFQGANPVIVGGSLVVNSMNFVGSSGLVVQSPTTTGPTPLCSQIAYLPISWQDF
jgi:hypothetical protein